MNLGQTKEKHLENQDEAVITIEDSPLLMHVDPDVLPPNDVRDYE